MVNFRPKGNHKEALRKNIEIAIGPQYSPFSQYPTINTPEINYFIEQILITHNKYRAAHGCPPLVLNQQISFYAQKWAQVFRDVEVAFCLFNFEFF